MSVISVPTTAAFVSLLLFAAPSPAQYSGTATPVAAAPAAAPAGESVPALTAGVSKVRIVRLSEVRGTVEMDRGTGRGFETATQNMPIVERCEVRTGMGVAEVEFEDNSTLRLGPDSAVAFPVLERLATGATVSEAQLLRGTAYVSMPKSAKNGLTLLFGSPSNFEKLAFSPGSHIRLDTDANAAKLAVFSGPVQLFGPDGNMALPARRTVDLSLAAAGEPKETKKIVAESLDSWDKQSAEYHASVASLSAFNTAPYAYGMNDLSYYGSFMDAGGCGMMWRPYFASAAWDPYANGAWAWYGGAAGYSWVSPYPWGWVPYHYGMWSFCPGMGWGWMPGGAWNGLMNGPGMMGYGTTGYGYGGGAGAAGGSGFKPIPHPPIRPPMQPPGPRQPTMVTVNTKPLVTSTVGSNSFVFRRDSAGLGVPREGLGNLAGFSRAAGRHGFASTPVFLTAGPARGFGGRNMTGVAPVEVHRGYSSQMSGMRSMGGGGWAGGRGMGAGMSTAGAGSSMPSAPSAPISSGGVSRGSMGGGGGVGAPSGGGAHPR